MNTFKKYKKIAFVLVFFQTMGIFAAGINLSSQFTTHVDVVFTNDVTKPVDLYPNTVENIDAFFEGFKQIRWKGMDGKMYQANPGIQGIENWIQVQITKDNQIAVSRLNQRTQVISGTPF